MALGGFLQINPKSIGRSLKGQRAGGRAFTGTVDVQAAIDALDDWQRNLIRARELKGATTAAAKVVRPRITQGYETGPKRITGALSRKAATRVKSVYYKRGSTAISIAGLKTKNIKTYFVDPEKAGTMARWHANQIEKGGLGKYRYRKKNKGVTGDSRNVFSTKGLGLSFRLQRNTLLGHKAWRINDSVSYETRTVRRKQKKMIKVKRNPSRISHLIEHGHRFAFGGKRATAFKVIKKAHDATKSRAQSALVQDLKRRTTEKARKAAAKGNKTK